jgi:hypothetical protein
VSQVEPRFRKVFRTGKQFRNDKREGRGRRTNPGSIGTGNRFSSPWLCSGGTEMEYLPNTQAPHREGGRNSKCMRIFLTVSFLIISSRLTGYGLADWQHTTPGGNAMSDPGNGTHLMILTTR